MQGRFHFHSILKSIRGRVIFYTDADRLLFLGIFRRFVDKYNVTVFEFVLMDNHVHILHTAGSYAQACTFVGELQQNYSFWYNRFHTSRDKIFIPAKVYPKFTHEGVLKCAFYILQNPMVACPKEYPHPQDYVWSSYHFHYDFMDNVRLMVKHSKDVFRANAMADIINSSRSVSRNRCPLLKSGYGWPDVKLLDFLSVSTTDIDSLYTKREFKIVVQKSIVSAKDEYANERAAAVTISKLSGLLSQFLEDRPYESLSAHEKEILIHNLFIHSRATVMQVVMLLDEDKNFVSQLYKKIR